MEKTAVLLLNVGTSASSSLDDVRCFLRQYLGDRHVTRLPWLIRKIFVNWVVVPLRAPRWAEIHRQLISQDGLPLHYYTRRLCDELQQTMDLQTDIFMAMNYGSPSIQEVLLKIQSLKYDRLIFVPLFPHHSIAVTQSIIDNINRQLKNFPTSTKVKIIDSFYRHPLFIDTWAKYIQTYNPQGFDHIIFSYHGLPLIHIPKRCKATNGEKGCACLDLISREKSPCYRGCCYEMSYILAERLGIANENYTTAFQSNFGKKWTQPSVKTKLQELASGDVKSVLVVPLSFVSDCLETTIEVGQEYKSTFLASSGKRFEWTTGLNDSPKWLTTLRNIILENGAIKK